MKQQVPKPMREVLLRQKPADEHPSADLLNAYVEQALPTAEKNRVIAHLSACEECREVVFLAGSAVGESTSPTAAAASASALSRRPRMMGWKWVVPAAALVVVVSGAVVERERIAMMLQPDSHTVAMESRTAVPAPSVPSPQETARVPAQGTVARVSPPASRLPDDAIALESGKNVNTAKPATKAQAAASERAAHSLKKSEESQIAKVASMPGAGISALQQSEAQKPAAAGSKRFDEVTTSAPLVAMNADVGSSTPAASPMSSAFAAKAADSSIQLDLSSHARQGIAGTTKWRISSDGHLEHSLSPGVWTRVLAAQPVTFRTVAVIGVNVWAGGSEGALFHSTDAGVHFHKVVLTDDGHSELGNIVSIRFDSVEQGALTSDAGTSWTTTDGGQSWTKQ